MSKQGPTPGPWEWRWKSGSLHQTGEPPYHYGKRVLSPTWGYDEGVGTEISEADARLIASAPDLLEALKDLLDDCELSASPIVAEAARAAIAKAEAND